MDIKELYIELSKYNRLKDISGYSQEYQDKYAEALLVVMDEMVNDLIEEGAYHE
jgi:hypothetical protein